MIPQNRLARIAILLLAVLVLGGVDQWSKYWLGHWIVGQTWHWGPLRLILYRNPGIAFSIWLPMWLALILIIGLLIFLIFLWLTPRRSWLDGLGLLLVISGGVSNLWDKWQLGYVRDFVSVGWLPVFNLADVLIFIGIVIIVWQAIYDRDQQKV